MLSGRVTPTVPVRWGVTGRESHARIAAPASLGGADGAGGVPSALRWLATDFRRFLGGHFVLVGELA